MSIAKTRAPSFRLPDGAVGWILPLALIVGWEIAADGAGGRDAVQARHGNVHESAVGPQESCFFQRFDTVGSFAADLPVEPGGEQGTNTAPHGFMIVDDEDAQCGHSYDGLGAAQDVFYLTWRSCDRNPITITL